MANWIRTHRVKFYLMLFLVLAIVFVGCVFVFASPQIPSIPIEYGEPVPIIVP